MLLSSSGEVHVSTVCEVCSSDFVGLIPWHDVGWKMWWEMSGTYVWVVVKVCGCVDSYLMRGCWSCKWMVRVRVKGGVAREDIFQGVGEDFYLLCEGCHQELVSLMFWFSLMR